MVKSMTGFGKGEAFLHNKKFTVEMRSVNSKQLDLGLKVPGRYRAAEAALRAIVSRTVRRGKVDLYLSVETAEAASVCQINEPLFRASIAQLNDLGRSCGLDTGGAAWSAALLQSVMRLPNMISSDEQPADDEEVQAICAAAEAAASELDKFRLQEGATLIADLLHRVDTIEALKNEVEPYEAKRVETIRSRIRENLDKLAVDVDANRLEQEMIFYLEKLDITEEKVRLKNHCDYFRRVALDEEDAGRKLGFIAQEMGREINTLGSKSNESNMQILVVKMKDELEKIKEQVLNLL